MSAVEGNSSIGGRPGSLRRPGGEATSRVARRRVPAVVALLVLLLCTVPLLLNGGAGRPLAATHRNAPLTSHGLLSLPSSLQGPASVALAARTPAILPHTCAGRAPLHQSRTASLRSLRRGGNDRQQRVAAPRAAARRSRLRPPPAAGRGRPSEGRCQPRLLPAGRADGVVREWSFGLGAGVHGSPPSGHVCGRGLRADPVAGRLGRVAREHGGARQRGVVLRRSRFAALRLARRPGRLGDTPFPAASASTTAASSFRWTPAVLPTRCTSTPSSSNRVEDHGRRDRCRDLRWPRRALGRRQNGARGSDATHPPQRLPRGCRLGVRAQR